MDVGKPLGNPAGSDVVHEMRNQLAVARAKGIALRVTRCAAASPACEHFFGDPVRIGQIVKNLALNAVRYTPAGGSISIDCSRRAGQLQVTVSDSGPGVKPDEAADIFKPRFRGAAAGGTPGSGHGLAIVKEFVERQGGTVEMASLSPSGASFCVRLPGETADANGAEVSRVLVQP